MKIKNKLSSVFKIGLLALFAGMLIAPAALAFDVEDLFSSDSGGDFTDFNPGEESLQESLEISGEDLNTSLTTTDDVREFVIRIVNFALGFLGLFAVIIIIYGGVLYVGAAGEQERADKGKKAITYATIGLLIVIGSFAFVNTIIRGAQGDDTSGDRYVTGTNIGNSFNASATQVREIARDIYSSFLFFAQAVEDINSIINDANKSSLNFKQTLVTENDILTFLRSAVSKLTQMKARVIKYSDAYNRLTDQINYLNARIDQVKADKTQVLVQVDKNGNLVIEDDELVWCFDNDDVCIYFDKEDENASIPYNLNPYEQWNSTRENLLSNDPDNKESLAYVLEPLKDDFSVRLYRSLKELSEIREDLIGITVVETGGVGELYMDMMNYYGCPATATEYLGCTFDESTNEVTEYGTDGVMADILGWNIDDAFFTEGEISRAEQLGAVGGALYNALETQLQFAEEISKLQSVVARLRANVTTGNAPLVVTFDVLESVDPAGGSIVDANVDWSNITGSFTYEGEEVTDFDASSVGGVNCSIAEPDPEVFGPAYRQCIFKYPGTYNATVTIQSNDPSKFVSGMSSIIIKVNPPKTKIDLDLETATETITIMDYYPEGVIRTNESVVAITDQEITLDASASENVTNYKWDFGDTTQISTDTTGVQTHKYDEKGRYSVTLEVTNKLGEVDRKIFTLEIGDVAARVKLTPSDKFFINQSIRFDGSSSTSTTGTIKAYEWEVSKKEGSENIPLDLPDGNKASFNYEFEETGIYLIDLTVTSDLGSASLPEPKEISVQSNPPEAVYDYEIPDTTQPSTVHFDASKSFDPDDTGVEELLYEWEISGPSETQTWQVTGELTSENPIVKFNEKGSYDVSLTVTDPDTVSPGIQTESTTTTKTIEIDNILDIAWSEDQVVTAQLDEKGEVKLNFILESDNATEYDLDFGNGDQTSGEFTGTPIPYTYTESGKYLVTATVYDEDFNKNSIQRRVYIGGGDMPIAQILLRVNGVEYTDLTEPIEVTKKDIITFDGSESQNIDGTPKNLKYSWDFGDTERSSSRSATHSYDELSPADPGYYTATLQVTDDQDPTLSSPDEVKITVINKPPKFSSIQAIPDPTNTDRVTPLNVSLKAFGAEDEDGTITQYRWWYFDIDDPEEKYGIQITTVPSAKMTIGTLGKEDTKVTYGFGLEVVDSDNLTVSSEDTLDEGQYPTVEVINGPNDLPTAKFSVDSTSVFVGDKVTFTSSSSDTDGEIVKYVWDTEGDGFFNNEDTTESSFEYTYTEKNLQGYDVRLKVIDDKGGEAVSQPIKIYVDSLAGPPKAAFKWELVQQTGGKRIKFINNSEADEQAGAEILGYSWDFDTDSAFNSADTDGDGIKNNDTDSTQENPEHTFEEFGTYKVRLKVTDNQGNTDEVTQSLIIPLAKPPVAAFTHQIVEGEVIFQNNSTSDIEQGAALVRYIWDFDTASTLSTADSDGDGNKTNDTDSSEKNPTHIFAENGAYQVKLTVYDSQGSTDSVTNTVDTTSFGVDPSDPNPNPDNQTSDIQAILSTNPAADGTGVILLSGESGQITFDFSKSLGPIASYTLDKNIYFDTDGNGTKDDDKDFKTTLPGTWKTNFEKEWGKTVVRLTVEDIYGNTDTTTKEVKFN